MPNPKTLIVERDVAVPMRDGTILRADVYQPAGGQPAPVLLQRTMYGKGFSQVALALMAAERGYAAVIQDTRGRWASEGENIPMVFEKDDGYDSVAWAAAQPWCNGVVGMFGGSYVGYTQYAAAAMQPPALKTIAPLITFLNPYSVSFTGGELNLGNSLVWGYLAIAQMDVMRAQVEPDERNRLFGTLIHMVDGLSPGLTFSHLPLAQLPLIGQGGLNPAFPLLLEHPTYDAYWEKIACRPEDIRIPTLLMGGWYDPFLANTLGDFNAIRDAGNLYLKLLIGPWTHGSFEGSAGEADFGMQANGVLVLPDELHLRWYDHWLCGADNGILQEPPVRIFVMGANCWRDENEWPLARTQFTRYYLHSAGLANTLDGDGRLSPEAPAEEPGDTFVYDPNDPVPTCGGPLLGWQAALRPGVFDQRPLEARPDVLVYTSAPLEQDLEVTGPLQVHLWAATTAPDTDFTAKLVDVHPSGYAQNLQDGILRAACRQGILALIIPGDPLEYVIDLAATSNVFKAGHRLRLEISSSNFPRFARNPNTGHASYEATELTTARQTILHDTGHPSYILLPLIPPAS